ncbi:kinase-like domain-containing protein [Globomyces pollinis-pini]|nr:kinase-like domain-containing protein [Globomyces pollinis-pini]
MEFQNHSSYQWISNHRSVIDACEQLSIPNIRPVLFSILEELTIASLVKLVPVLVIYHLLHSYKSLSRSLLYRIYTATTHDSISPIAIPMFDPPLTNRPSVTRSNRSSIVASTDLHGHSVKPPHRQARLSIVENNHDFTILDALNNNINISQDYINLSSAAINTIPIIDLTQYKKIKSNHPTTLGHNGKIEFYEEKQTKEVILVKITPWPFDVEEIPLEAKYNHILSGFEYFPIFYGYCIKNEKAYLAYEYLGNDWIDLHMASEQKHFTFKECINMVKQLLNACKIMADNGIYHGDLKDANILVHMKSLEIRILDFGGSRPQTDELLPANTFSGTPNHALPTIILGHDYFQANQTMWSIGCIIYKLLFNEVPFNSTGPAFGCNMRARLDEWIESSGRKFKKNQLLLLDLLGQMLILPMDTWEVMEIESDMQQISLEDAMIHPVFDSLH